MKNQVYAVVRIDDYQEGEAAIRVKKILPTMEDAIKEGERLSKLKSSKSGALFLAVDELFCVWRKYG